MSLRKKLNKLLANVGYEIVKKDRFNECLVKEYAKSDDFFFIQIGANDGVKFDYLYDFVTQNNCKGVVVEPLKAYFERLQNNYSDYPDIVPVNIAIHDAKKTVDVYYVDPKKLGSVPEWAEGIGSLDYNHHKKHGISSDCIVSDPVECLHLMELINQYTFTPLNLLQIDVEGYDGEVVKMIDFATIKPRLIKYEHSHIPKNVQKEVIKLLKGNGYKTFRQGGDTVGVLEDAY